MGASRAGDDVEVRPFAPDDEAGVVALWERVFPDARPWNGARAIVARKAAMRDGLFLVAIGDGALLGAVVAGWDGQRGWLYHLAVDLARRRRGIGRRLVAAAEAALARRGCPKMNLQVMASNADVVAFYERLGWSVEARVSMGKTLATDP